MTITNKTPAHVAKLATVEADLSNRAPILLGTTGTETDRRALIRNANGQVSVVEIGDLINGAKIVFIGVDKIYSTRNGLSHTMSIPWAA